MQVLLNSVYNGISKFIFSLLYRVLLVKHRPIRLLHEFLFYHSAKYQDMYSRLSLFLKNRKRKCDRVMQLSILYKFFYQGSANSRHNENQGIGSDSVFCRFRLADLCFRKNTGFNFGHALIINPSISLMFSPKWCSRAQLWGD